MERLSQGVQAVREGKSVMLWDHDALLRSRSLHIILLLSKMLPFSTTSKQAE